MQKMDGMNYAPVASGKKVRVVPKNRFRFAVVGLDHGHIYGMTNGLCEAGATLVSVYDEDPQKVEAFRLIHPEAVTATSVTEILTDPGIALVVSAIRPDRRATLGISVMEQGKDFFADKPGMLTETEIEMVRNVVQKTGRKYMVYFSERIHVEGAVFAQELVEHGVLGDIINLTILAPHRLNKETRPDWFFDPQANGGILVDIGSHQIEQFLTFTGAKTATILSSVVGNYGNPDHPAFEDCGQVMLMADNGAAGTVRVDWFTPDGLGAWGDGRLFLVGTKASLEVRKYLDIARDGRGDQVYWVDDEGEHHRCVVGVTGFPFFGAFILDCINRTENAITQEHVFETMRLAIEAEKNAKKVHV